MKFRISIFFSLMALAACESEPENLLVRNFTIQQGEHYSTPRLVETLQSGRLAFDATFDHSARYTFDDRSFQDSKNKLLGFADCNSPHHENSARFAWQWYDDLLEIYAYCYVNDQRTERFVGTVNVKETNHYEIILSEREYVFKLNDYAPVSIPRGDVCDKGLYYMLWPYFGGSLPAPHDVHIAVAIKR